MAVNEQEFWTALQKRHAVELERETRELEEIERRLADAPEAPLLPEQIERTVAAATGQRSAGKGGRGRVVRTGRFRRAVAAAAAIIVMPKFLTAATAVTAVALGSYLLWPSRQYSTWRLSLQDAVVLMMDREEPFHDRSNAMGHLYGLLHHSARYLRESRDSDDPLGAEAGEVLQILSWQLDAGFADGFEFRSLPTSYLSAIRSFTDRTEEIGVRRESLRQLADHLSYGLEALFSLRRTSRDTRVHDKLDFYFERLGREFGG